MRSVIVHIIPGAHWVDDVEHGAIAEVARRAEEDVREHLPTLERDLYLIVHQTTTIIPETGDGAYTVGPHCIRWDVDPARGIEQVARTHLRRTLFHECHHAVRLQRRPEETELVDWPTVVVFEGLASCSRTKPAVNGPGGGRTTARSSGLGRTSCSLSRSMSRGRTGSSSIPMVDGTSPTRSARGSSTERSPRQAEQPLTSSGSRQRPSLRSSA